MIKVKIIIGIIILFAMIFALIKGGFGLALVLGITLVLIIFPNTQGKEPKDKGKLDEEIEELDEEIYSATSE